jgi:hypothetical protein
MPPIELSPPRVLDEAARERGRRRWDALRATRAGEVVAVVKQEPAWDSLLDGVFSGSPFLIEALTAEPDLLHDLLRPTAPGKRSRPRPPPSTPPTAPG